MHKFSVQTRFADFDRLGHMNNAVYFQLLDTAKVDYFEKALGLKPGMADVCPVVANISINFISPIMPDEELAVHMRTEKFGDKSFVLYQRIVNELTDEIKCEASVVMVNFDFRNKQTVAMSEEQKAAIKDFDDRE